MSKPTVSPRKTTHQSKARAAHRQPLPADRAGESSAGTLLPLNLATVVPLLIEELQRQGGPSAADYARSRSFSQELAEHGDAILYRSAVPGRTADLVTKLADAIAVLAFLPGGIALFGQRWEADARAAVSRSHPPST